MANMNFGVNILPKANNTYTLGNSDYKWNIFANTLNGVSLTNIITDIQIDGTSIISNNVASIPLASYDNFGVIKLGKGLEIYNNTVVIGASGSVKIKAGAEPNNPIVPAKQHEATFYGLAKAAGDSTQASSSNAIGVYTDTAKTAIQSMLSVVSSINAIITNSISLGRKANTTVGTGSVALGQNVEASGDGSVAFGINTAASNSGAYAEGYGSISAGDGSHAEGTYTTANATISHAEGFHTIANGIASHVGGQYNVADSYDNWPLYDANATYNIGDRVKVLDNGSYKGQIKTATDWIDDPGTMTFAEIIGNGSADNARANARALDWDGNEYLNGNLYINCNNDSTNGYKVIADVNNSITIGSTTITEAQFQALLAML